MRDKLAPFRPVRKYVAVKSVIFLSYWQGFLLQLVAPTVRAAEDAQNFLITLEMSVAAVGMAIAFPASQFQSRTPATSDGVPPADAEHPATETGSSSLKDVPEQVPATIDDGNTEFSTFSWPLMVLTPYPVLTLGALSCYPI